MRNFRTLVIFFSIINFSIVYSQNKIIIDSLNVLLSKSSNDTNKVIILNQLCGEYETFNSDKALEYGNLSLSLAKHINYKNGIALSLNKIGVVHFHKGNYKDAISHYLQSLKINEEIGNIKGVADNLSNIATVYQTQDNYEKALKYALQALKIDEESGNKPAIAISHTNIGNIYLAEGNYQEALRYYQLALRTFEALSDKQNTAIVLSNLGSIYFNQDDFNNAIANYERATKIYESIGDKIGIAMDFNNVGQVYYKRLEYKKAIVYYKKSLVMAKEIGAKDIVKSNYENLSEVSEKMKDYKSAYEYHKLFSNIKDTLLNAEINKQIDEMAIKYETTKKEKENARLKKETNKQQFLNKRQKETLNYLMLGLIIISVTGLIFFIRSRSKQKTNELLKELVALKTQEENELRKAKNAVEQSMKLKEQFLANMSHEIRTPLNAIIGFTDLLYKDNLESNEKEYIQFIKSAGENLINIVNDILDISKIEASMITFEEKPISICTLFRSLEILLEPKAKEKNLKLSFNCNDEVPDWLTGDPTRFTQIFINLVGNAIKFTEKGSIKINARLLKEENEIAIIEFSVKDTGIGIPPEKLDFIFERFTQAEAATTRKYGGTGLGLSIVKHLIELQKGNISVISEPGKGSEFIFSIPFKPAEYIPVETGNMHKILPRLGKLKILLVEDNILNVKLTLALFSNTDVEIEVAGNGKEGIELLQKKEYDLILMDMQMPIMDGYQATEYIRETLKSDIPIIALTAHAMAGEREKCLQLGMNDYVPKPINANVLFEKINYLTSVEFNKNNTAKKNQDSSTKLLNLNYLLEIGIKNKPIKEMLDDFAEQMAEDFPLLRGAVSQEDYDTIENISHKLKSPAFIMGISKMEKILLEMEKQANARTGIEKIESWTEELNVLYTQVLTEIEIEKSYL